MSEIDGPAARLLALTMRDAQGFARVRPASSLGPVGSCFANAWEQAQHHGWRYCEGTVVSSTSPFDAGWVMPHAWCLDAEGVARECTTGFQIARQYRGFVLDPQAIAAAGLRGGQDSVLGQALAVGLDEDTAVRQLTVAASDR